MCARTRESILIKSSAKSTGLSLHPPYGKNHPTSPKPRLVHLHLATYVSRSPPSKIIQIHHSSDSPFTIKIYSFLPLYRNTNFPFDLNFFTTEGRILIQKEMKTKAKKEKENDTNHGGFCKYGHWRVQCDLVYLKG